MMDIVRLQNVIQEYAWGSTTDIPELLGQPNIENKPQAELWMGAHPKAPSQIFYQGQRISLLEVIQKHPIEMLGENAAKHFQNKLPYLFKVLAAAKPLSIQAHPSLEQARKGFAHENEQKIPMDAYNRNYKDDNHKPECICALTPFWALNGFRAIDTILYYLEVLCEDQIEKAQFDLKINPNKNGLKDFFKTLLTLESAKRMSLIERIVKNAQKADKHDPVYEWIIRLNNEYKEDIGILSPAFLNLVLLKPGEALFLPSGQLHSYLSGMGIELMANSDNVLRGGLTPKHVDVPELLRVLSFEPTDIRIMRPEKISPSESVYKNPAKEFILSVIHLEKGTSHISVEDRSMEIVLCTEGSIQIKPIGVESQETILVCKGESVAIPAAVTQYYMEGRGIIYKAGVPND